MSITLNIEHTFKQMLMFYTYPNYIFKRHTKIVNVISGIKMIFNNIQNNMLYERFSQ